MTPQDFQTQMSRLTETFGKTPYGTERVKLLWNEVKDFDARWFERLVSRFIGDCRQAPLLSEFREAASRERERIHDEEKRQEQNETFRALKGHLAGEDVSMVVQTIKGILSGQLGEKERNGLREMLAAQVRYSDSLSPPDCRHCADVGLQFVENGVHAPSVLTCSCERGRADPRAFPRKWGN